METSKKKLADLAASLRATRINANTYTFDNEMYGNPTPPLHIPVECSV